VGEDGRTHQGFADVSFLRCLPGMVVSAPADGAELGGLLRSALAHGGPFAIRYPRGRAPIASGRIDSVEVGRGVTVREGDDVGLIALGSMVPVGLEAAERLADTGVQATVVNARFAKPLDETLILETAIRTRGIVT